VRADGCAQGWLPFGGRCYGFFPQEMSWRKAEGHCRTLGAHLASIHSEEEHEAIAGLLASSQPYSHSHEEEAGDEVWIGLHRPLRVSWEWSDGSKLDYGSRYRRGSSRRRACAALLDSTGERGARLCSRRKPFICEYHV
uniref:C-type lectin domain-containing protein n=1 Tax=Nothoprocta perdicaria TaxID=30464 RepID=A0A8C6ZSN6_NOTPE